MTIYATSYMPTDGAAVGRKSDDLYFTFNARPQAMTVYVRFVELAAPNWVNIDGNSPRIWHIGLGSHPAFFVFKTAGAATYAARFGNNAGTTTTSTLTLSPTRGDLIELRTTLTAGGVVQLHGTKNRGAESSATASSALTLPQSWSAAQLTVAGRNGVGTGDIALLNGPIFARGIHTLEAMRRIAGV